MFLKCDVLQGNFSCQFKLYEMGMHLGALSQIRKSSLQITKPFGQEQWSIRFIPPMQSTIPVPVSWLQSSVSSHTTSPCHDWKCCAELMFLVCAQKQETFTRCSKKKKEFRSVRKSKWTAKTKKRGNQLSELFNERKTLCAELESASGLAELQIHFNMRKCEREKRRGKDVRHSRDRGERPFLQSSETGFFLGAFQSKVRKRKAEGVFFSPSFIPFSYDAMRERGRLQLQSWCTKPSSTQHMTSSYSNAIITYFFFFFCYISV